MAIKRDKLIAELEARQIGYKDEMSDEELKVLLEKAKAKEKKAGKPHPDGPVSTDMAGVFCGIRTIHDHERRLRIIERKLGLKPKE